jgi:hypothetical protein
VTATTDLLRAILAQCDRTTAPGAALAEVRRLVEDHAHNFYLDLDAADEGEGDEVAR